MKEPEDCKKEYEEEICENCPLMSYDMVGHPGGDNTRSAKRHYCEIGHWKEDF
jgi:hypothetical protein